MNAKMIYSGLVLLSFITWSCSTTTQEDLSQASLKSSLNENVVELNTAVASISASSGYQLLSASGTSESSNSASSKVKASVSLIDSIINSIALSDISGIYDYKAVTIKHKMGSILRFFNKTAENSQMIVRLPEEKIKNSKNLLRYSASDTLLTNNYVITVSKYQYNFNRFLGWDYDMASNINIKSVNAGDLKIKSSNDANGYKFNSEFAFADGYTAKCVINSGDTAVSTYAISQGSNILYQEKYTAIKSTFRNRHRENYYSLTIGNVEVVRKQGKNSLDSAKVYVGGILQTNSKVEFVDLASDSTDVSIVNHKRDIKITFDDGTSSTISQLLGTSVDTIRIIFVSLRQTYFATDIVDSIAWDIYAKKNY